MQKLNFLSPLLVAIIIFLVGATYVLAWNSGDSGLHGHSGDNVFIYVNGNSKSLQTAINDNEFSSPFTGGGSYSSIILFGQPGEELIVNVAGTQRSLQTAINDGSLCNSAPGTSPQEFGAETYGNTGDEVEIVINSVNKNLQKAINDGDFSACHVTYIMAETTQILPEIIRRNSNDYDVQISLILGATPLTELDQTAHLLLQPGGVQSHTEFWYSDGTNAKAIGLFRKSDILNSISQNGEIEANITGKMLAENSYYYGEDTFHISLYTGS